MKSDLHMKKVEGFGGVDPRKLKILIEDGFRKTLAEGYFHELDPEAVYLAQIGGNYLGVIVLERTRLGIAYLDKFVVASSYQNNGIGGKLWGQMKRNEKKVFWRARPDNPINGFYMSVCDGMQKTGQWFVYWVGLSPEELAKAINYVLSREDTLISRMPQVPLLETA